MKNYIAMHSRKSFPDADAVLPVDYFFNSDFFLFSPTYLNRQLLIFNYIISKVKRKDILPFQKTAPIKTLCFLLFFIFLFNRQLATLHGSKNTKHKMGKTLTG